MSALSEKLKKMAELNFCETCYQKYVMLIHGQVEHLLSEPLFDWTQTEDNINKLWIKAKGYYKQRTDSTVFSPSKTAFNRARGEKLWKKLDFLKREKIIGDSFYRFLEKVSDRRNKVHPPSKFSKQDYVLFREARGLTDTILMPIIFDLKDDRWKRLLTNVENHAKQVLSKLNSKPDTKLDQQT